MNTIDRTKRKSETVDRDNTRAQRLAVETQEKRPPLVVDDSPASKEREDPMSATELTRVIAYEIYRVRCNAGSEGDELSDWLAAERSMYLRDDYYRKDDLGMNGATEMKTARGRGDGQVPPA